MSEDKKDLGDKAEDAFDNAKKKAKDYAEDAKESAKDFTEDAKEAAEDFSENAKRAASDFKEETKRTFDATNPDAGKNVAIIAHITIIGWIVALVMNGQNRTEIGSFYIRQVLGIGILGLVVSWIPLINLIGWILVVVLWVMSLIGAINGTEKPIFLLGTQFQEWFKSL
ncbi:YtxH domain-containing protein [Flavobacteriaceae bacterium F89]|uniref:YtxH domain-containing protein n=1 Tax=Cerina litoralis TaxID=2874477 RepID=A0AAE3EXG3_9FLAO|nr:YtxH domain-containing protein [Cerina litoralis]MCG2461561.1 YtxH domain-containing protein [Cerina litoralis]